METTQLAPGTLVLVGWGKLGPDEIDPAANAFVAEVLGPAAKPGYVALRSVSSGKRFAMKHGGPWFRGLA